MRMIWAASASGVLPGSDRRGARSARCDAARGRSAGELPERSFLHRRPGAARCLRGSAGRGARRRSRSRAREASKTIAEAERVLRELAAAGARRDDLRARPRRRSGRGPGRASAPPPTSAGSRWSRSRRPWSRRWTPPTAARPGWTCPRPRTTSAPTTSRSPFSPTPRRSRRCRAEELAAGFVEVVKTALLAGGELWERVRALESARSGRARRRDLRLRPHEDRRSSPPTSATRAAARCSTWATRSGTRSRPARRLRALPPRRGGRARSARGAAALGRRRAPRPRSPGCSPPTACRSRSTRRSTLDDVVEAIGRDKKATGAGHRLRAARAARASRAGARAVEPDRVRGVRGGAVRMSRARTTASRSCTGSTSTCSAAATRCIYGGLHAVRARGEDQALRAPSWASRSTFFQTNHEGEYVEHLHRLPGDRRRRDHQPGRLDALLLGDPRRARVHRGPGRRDPPLRRLEARGVAQASRCSTGSSPASAASTARDPTATARRSRSSPGTSAPQPDGSADSSGRARRPARRAARPSASSTCCSSPTSPTSAT